VNFERRARRTPPEPVVPLINVVFLLLIFFMLAGTLRSSPTLDVRPPALAQGTDREPSRERAELEVDSQGRLALDGEAVPRSGWRVSLAERLRGWQGPLDLRADAQLPAKELHPLLEVLRDAGISETRLVVSETQR